MMEIQEIEEILQQKQNPHRYRHTIGVRYTSICLAMRYGEDLTRASYAGLLHDCAKHMSKQTLDYLRDQGGEIDPATEVTYNYYLQKCAENTEG